MRARTRFGLCSILVLAAGAGVASGQLIAPPPGQPAAGEPTPNPAAGGEPSLVVQSRPKMTFDKVSIDLGKIVDVESVEARFTFKNTGVDTLKILNKHATCGCTLADLPKMEYAPGESGEIVVTYNPRGKQGPQNQSITLTTNDPTEPRITLNIAAQVQPVIVVDPVILQLGQIGKGMGKKAAVTVTGRSSTFRVTDVTSSDKALVQMSTGQPEAITVDGESGTKTIIEVIIPENHPVGRIQQSGTIRTNDPRREIINFQVIGEVTGELAPSPVRVAFGNIRPGQPIKGEVKLASRLGKPFKIVAARAESPLEKPIEVIATPDNLQGEASTSWTLAIKGEAPHRTVLVRGEVIIQTDVEGEKELRVPFWGTVREQ